MYFLDDPPGRRKFKLAERAPQDQPKSQMSMLIVLHFIREGVERKRGG